MIASLLILAIGAVPATDGASPPALPLRPPAVAGECSRAYPVRALEPMPPALLTPAGTAACGGILIPTSLAAWYELVVPHAELMGDLYRIDTMRLQMQVGALTSEVNGLRVPAPWYERPTVQRWFGRGEVLLTVGIAAYGLHAVASAP